MIIEKMESIKPGNPFLSDLFRMGIQIGSNVTIMFMKHSTEKQDDIVIIDTETGERIQIVFDK